MGGSSTDNDLHLITLYYVDLNRGHKGFLSIDDPSMNRIEEILHLDTDSQLSEEKLKLPYKRKRKRKNSNNRKAK